jgi:hypothetical protein
MTFHSDKDTTEMDIFLCFAVHLLVGGADENWLFPEMAKLKQPLFNLMGFCQKVIGRAHRQRKFHAEKD